MKKKIVLKQKNTNEGEEKPLISNLNIEVTTIDILKLFLIILSMYFIPSLFFKGISIFIESDNIANIISNLLYLIVLVGLFYNSFIEEFKIFKNNYKKCIKTGIKYWGIGLIGMIICNLIINLVIFKGNISANEELTRELIFDFPLYSFISAVFIAPVIEEIIFRKAFRMAFKNVIVFAVTSGFFFGLLHATTAIETPLSLLYILPYGALGAAFAVSYHKTETVFTPIVIHAMHNALTIILLLAVL